MMCVSCSPRGGPRTSQSEHRFQIYKRYPEREAAEHSGCDYSTLKRKRRAALVPFVDLGAGSVG